MTTAMILVVEDDPNLLDTLVYNLRREDYEVVTAANGSDAVELAREQRSPTLLSSMLCCL